MCVIACAWGLASVLANPVGDFPLCDDWSYGRSVVSLLGTGHLRFTGWVSMPLVVQTVWGALFCLPFGFSFTALRLSTLVLGMVALLAVYGVLREAGARRDLAVLGSLTFGLNPLFLLLSYTFMTDVPFCALMALSLLLFMRGTRRRKPFETAGGVAVACAATMIRQVGLVVPLVFAVGHLARHGMGRRSLAVALLPIAIAGALLGGYRAWLEGTHGLPAGYDVQALRLLNTLRGPLPSVLAAFCKRGAVALVYLGLFLLPVLVPLVLRRRAVLGERRGGRGFWVNAVPAAFFVIAAGWVLVSGRAMPLSDNILSSAGLGPATLRDEFILHLHHLHEFPRPMWVAVTFASIGGGALLLTIVLPALGGWWHLGRARQPGPAGWVGLSMAVGAAVYFVPLGIAGYFDRYLIPLVLLVMVVVVAVTGAEARIGTRGVVASASLLVLFGTFSVSATHDYLAWNRARWRAARDLVEGARVSPSLIDGGFEFNGWYGYDPAYRQSTAKSWWWVRDDEYLIPFGAVRGYGEIRRYRYRHWLPPGEGAILVLRRQS